MEHIARFLSPAARSGRLSLPVLLTIVSIVALLGLGGWQAWLRYGDRSSAQDGALPDDKDLSQTKGPDVQPPAGSEPDDDGAFLGDKYGDKVVTAAALVGLGAQGGGSAPAELGLIRAGERRRLWILGAPESAPTLRREVLGYVQDSEPVASGKTGKPWNDREFEAYMEALGKASWTPASAFANSAANNIHVTYAQLMQDPGDYRGEVIHVEGRLKRLRRFNPPAAVAERMTDFYEGWIFLKERGSEPVCLVFMELPQGLWVAEKMEVPVAFDGYFFKRYRYKAEDSGQKQAREAPLLIGRTVILKGSPIVASQDDGTFSTSMLVVFFVLTVTSVGLAAGLTWWFWRGDRQVRARVAGARTAPFLESLNSREVQTDPLDPP
jgi:hypothetical protein